MKKIKTSKAAQKRFKISGKGKFIHGSVNKSHYNANDSGNETRRKRRNHEVNSKDIGTMRKLMPYT
jgi:large subunit ribosomal protein L35